MNRERELQTVRSYNEYLEARKRLGIGEILVDIPSKKYPVNPVPYEVFESVSQDAKREVFEDIPQDVVSGKIVRRKSLRNKKESIEVPGDRNFTPQRESTDTSLDRNFPLPRAPIISQEILNSVPQFAKNDRGEVTCPFRGFTQEALKTFIDADQEARRFNHPQVGIEHILLGLTNDLKFIDKLPGLRDVSRVSVRERVYLTFGKEPEPVEKDRDLTPRAKKVVDIAVDEARRLKHDFVRNGHLLLGLIGAGDEITLGILKSMGVSLERVLIDVIRNLGKNPHNP